MRTTRFNRTAAAVALFASLCGAAVSTLAADEPPVQKVTVRAVAHFGFDGTTLDPQDQASLLSEVGAMKDVTWQTVTATGYTDSVGKVSYNQTLSQRRAVAVKSYLTGKGLPPTLVRTAGKGPEAPIADNGTDEGRAQNRRTEVVFEGVKAK